MKTYALVGKSGTGKSYQAMNLCREKNIKSIIDDGLYIHESKAMAGISAKRQSTKIGAIKTALFNDEDHRKEVIETIVKTNPESILLLGTSDGMAKKIQERLKIPTISEVIYIEEITTEEERKSAYKQRMYQGKHVVPVPTFQLKRQFSGYFMDPLRIFKDWGVGKASFADKSVVRPTYSYLGEYLISDKVLRDIILEIGAKNESVSEVIRVISENRGEELSIDVVVNFFEEFPIVNCAKQFQRDCAHMIEMMTAFNLENIDIEVREFI